MFYYKFCHLTPFHLTFPHSTLLKYALLYICPLSGWTNYCLPIMLHLRVSTLILYTLVLTFIYLHCQLCSVVVLVTSATLRFSQLQDPNGVVSERWESWFDGPKCKSSGRIMSSSLIFSYKGVLSAAIQHIESVVRRLIAFTSQGDLRDVQWVYCTTWPAVARAGEVHVIFTAFPLSFPCDAHIPHLSLLVRQSGLCSRPVHTWIKLRSV